MEIATSISDQQQNHAKLSVRLHDESWQLEPWWLQGSIAQP